MTKQEILAIATRQSALDCAADEADFTKKENIIREYRVSGGERRDLGSPQICILVSYGGNIVAACAKELIPEVTAYINGSEKIHRCFETPAIYDLNRILEKADAEVFRMHTGFLPDPDAVFSADLRCPYEVRVLHPEDFTGLYVPEWDNALCADRKELDMLGVGAYDSGELIGLAGCSADGKDMWQIGIDVLPAYRQQGVASVLTNRLAREVFGQGKMPFYCAAWSNVRSYRNGIKSGFRPAWVELSARKKP